MSLKFFLRSYVVLFCWLFSCSSDSVKSNSYSSPVFYQNQQQYYYPRPQQYYYYPQQYYYPPVNTPNSRYYSNPYATGYPDYDSYYSVPTYHNSYRENEEKARERSAGVADDMLD